MTLLCSWFSIRNLNRFSIRTQQGGICLIRKWVLRLLFHHTCWHPHQLWSLQPFYMKGWVVILRPIFEFLDFRNLDFRFGFSIHVFCIWTFVFDSGLYVLNIRFVKIDVRYCPSVMSLDARNPFQGLWFCHILSGHSSTGNILIDRSPYQTVLPWWYDNVASCLITYEPGRQLIVFLDIIRIGWRLSIVGVFSNRLATL